MASRSLIAGIAYCGVVFAVGFVLGALRVTLVVPRLGETVAVALELPVILAISWMACRWLIVRFAVPADRNARLVMGATAFAVLMAAELGVSMIIFGRTLADHLDQYRTAPSLLGLTGQLAFAAFPLLQAKL